MIIIVYSFIFCYNIKEVIRLKSDERLSLSSNLKRIRKDRKLSQSELAEKAGISRVAIGSYENGKRIPNASILSKLAHALEIDVNNLLNFNPIDELKSEIIGLEKEESDLLKKKSQIEKLIKEINKDKLQDSDNEKVEDLERELLELFKAIDETKNIKLQKSKDLRLLDSRIIPIYSAEDFVDQLIEAKSSNDKLQEYIKLQETLLVDLFRLLNAKGREKAITSLLEITSVNENLHDNKN